MTRVARVVAFFLPLAWGLVTYVWVVRNGRPPDGQGYEWQVPLLLVGPLVVALAGGILCGERRLAWMAGALVPVATAAAMTAALGIAEPGQASMTVLYLLIVGLSAGSVASFAARLQKPAYRFITGKSGRKPV